MTALGFLCGCELLNEDVPVELLFSEVMAKFCYLCPIASFDLPIRLRVVCHFCQGLQFKESAKCFREFRNDFGAIFVKT